MIVQFCRFAKTSEKDAYRCEFALACGLPSDHVPFLRRGNDDLGFRNLSLCELHVTYTRKLVCFVGSEEYKLPTGQFSDKN